MGVPSRELMNLVAGGTGRTAAPGPNPMQAVASGNAPPPGGPMTTPQPQEGVKQAAMVNVNMALDLLEQALPAFGSENPEGQSLLASIRSLAKVFGGEREKSKELVPAELRQLLQQLGGSSGALAAKAMPGGGAAPPGAMPAGSGASMM